MKNIFVFFCIFILITGCADTPKPVADLKYISFKKVNSNFGIFFSSNIELENIHSAKNGEKVVANWLTCALKDDQNFSVEHRLQNYFKGEISRINSSDKNKFIYRAYGNFYNSSANGTDRSIIYDSKITNTISARASIPCKVVMTVYMKKPYYSNIINIPTIDIIKSVEIAK